MIKEELTTIKKEPEERHKYSKRYLEACYSFARRLLFTTQTYLSIQLQLIIWSNQNDSWLVPFQVLFLKNFFELISKHIC